MNPEIAKTLVKQRNHELRQQSARSRRGSVLRLPKWHVSWSRTILSPVADESAGRLRRGSSLVIVISAHRSA
jgi:hypothetical protein